MKKTPSKYKSWFQKKEKTFPKEEVSCKNCEYIFKGHFCPNCGQSVKEIDKPFSFVIYDFMGTMFAFDARFLHSLFTLLTKPGKITSDFIAGKRAKYMPPFRFYIFISFLFFFILTAGVKQKVSAFEKKAEIDSLKTSLMQEAQLAQDSLNTEFNSDIMLADVFSDTIVGIDSTERIEDYLLREMQNDSTLSKISNSRLISQFKKAKEYPEIYITKYFQFFSWSLFFLMPVFALFLKLLYTSQRRNYIQHFIFSVNFHSFLFFILIILASVNFLFSGAIVGMINYLAFIVPIYLVLGMKKFYKQKTGKTIFKAFLLSAAYNLVILAALIAIAFYAFINF